MAAAYHMGFRELTQVQKLSLPLLCADPPQNVTVRAHSGSGKIAAMASFILNRIVPREKHSQAFFVTFTLELAVHSVICPVYSGVTCTTGGMYIVLVLLQSL